MGIANITNNILTDSGAVIGAANGVATLDSGGKIPVSQLPNSVMEFKGTWSAATNTPTLANGTGNAGDVYEVTAAGTVNFGAGGIAFAVGDYVVYDGSTWQYSSGQKGTITSLTFSAPLTGGTITTSGTVGIPAATSTVNGYLTSTDWTTFNGKQNALTNPVTGTGTGNYIVKWATNSTIGNSIIYDNGINVGIGTTSPIEPLSVSFAAHGLISQHRQSSGLGVGQNFYMKFNDANGSAVNYAGIYADIQANTAGAHSGRMILQVANAGSLVSALTIMNNGKVGIGQTSPAYTLDVNGSGRLRDEIWLNSSGQSSLVFQLADVNKYNIAYNTNGYLQFYNYIASNVAMVISGSSNIGIQTTSPVTALQVGSGTVSSIPSWMRIMTADTTQTGVGAVYNNKALYIYNNGSELKLDAYDYASSVGLDVRIGGNGGKIILQGGNVGINTTSPNYKLDVNGDINIPGTNKLVFNNEPNSWFLQARTTASTANLGSGLKNLFYNGGGTNEGIAFSGVGTGAASMEVRNDGRVWVKENLIVGGVITENSSIRYKDNIETVKDGLDIILSLRGVTYNKKQTGTKELGLIAEEVQSVLPDVVIKDAEGKPDSVAYARIVAVLVEAVKELKQEINVLNGKLNS